ncbi:asialoglycoprotein receptor 1-like [Seriola aureovittata]|uniref:asialoglycoprotein receptor 1-like n=1 Tax=Seriola aureovittata TaxID=2871759 RepID=UPI0024BDD160|nr:asialoglycoprotein receptor 1-like [Seriola aureovittata]
MSEEEINYASVVFKPKNKPPPEAKDEEETVYDEVKVHSQTSEQTADTNGLMPYKKGKNSCGACQLVACFLSILCVILIIGIIVVCIYFVSPSQDKQLDQLKHNQTTLLAENDNLTKRNTELISDNENLRQNKDNLTVQLNQLKTMYNVSESKLKNLTEENQDLKKQNQELEAQRNNLTQQIEKNETEWNELNVTRAQWSIDAYCPIERDKRHCNPCQDGWLNNTSSCYAINNAVQNEQKTWKEARENCRGKASDLVVVVDEKEKEYIIEHSWDSSGTRGYWIGLRVEDGRWKWVDGSDLTKESWIGRPEKDHCAISVLKDREWKSVSCSDRNRWICEKAALSV